MNNLQAPLQNLDYENSVLATLMSVDNSYIHVSEILNEDDFSFERNRLIFRAVKALVNKGFPVDCSTVHDQLEQTKTLHSAGGDEYLTFVLGSSFIGLFNLVHYAKRIKELSQQRRIRSVLFGAHSAINDDGNDVDVKISNIVSELIEVSKDSADATKKPRSISTLIEGFLTNQENLMKGIKPKFHKTGFLDLDQKAQIQNGHLVVLAARPAMGKTTLAMNKLARIVDNNRILDKDGKVISEKTGVIFSLEMPAKEMMIKFLSAEAGVGVNNKNIKEGLITEDEWVGIQNKIMELGEDYPLYIDDQPMITYQQMRSRLVQLQAEGKEIGVVVIDYLQIMGGLDANNLTNSIAEVTGNLKALAKEMNCPIILLSQLNRDLEKRPNKRPINSDLRSSGSIEQDADIIIFVYRDEVYNENSEHKGVAEIIIGKNRHGEIGTVRLGFDGAKSKFTNFMPQYDEDGHPFHA